METTAGILRQLHELGRSSALRRVLTRVTETFVRQAPVPAPAFTSRRHHWGDVFWEAPTRHAGDRTNDPVMKQRELFGWLEESEHTPSSGDALSGEPEANRTRAERLAKQPAAVGVLRVRTPGRPPMYSERRRTVAGEAIARLLEVNRSVNGLGGVPVVELPGRRFSAQVDLWKGRPVGTPFVMGN